MNSYRKGSNAEREIIKILDKNGFTSIRIAGSGNNNKPDIISWSGKKHIALECKVTSKKLKYVDKNEVLEFFNFCRRFNVDGWYAIKFNRYGWRFIPIASISGNRKISYESGICLKKFISLVS